MEPKPHEKILNWSNAIVNARPIVDRKWLLANGKVCIVTVVRDGREGVGNYEAIIVNESQSCQTWGRNARTLLAHAKRRAGNL